MAHPRGELGSDAVRLDFDRRLMLQFRGSLTSDAVRFSFPRPWPDAPYAAQFDWRHLSNGNSATSYEILLFPVHNPPPFPEPHRLQIKKCSRPPRPPPHELGAIIVRAPAQSPLPS